MQRDSYDYLIVGAGLYGSIFANEAHKRGFTVLVIDSRDHIGGNCFTKNMEGTNVHVYGPHIFHTNNKEIWDYVNSIVPFNNFVYRPKVIGSDNKLYSFPINLMTLYQVYGVRTPAQAKVCVEFDCKPLLNDNLEEWAISQIGSKLYNLFIREYTRKQWNMDPKELPSSIIKRLPVRYNFDDNYFNDQYQGIPVGGYTGIFEKLLNGIEVSLNTPFEHEIGKLGKKIIYTGPIDGYYDYCLGKLEYRSLRFDHRVMDCEDFQGNAVINHADGTAFTRIIEHKHFEKAVSKKSVVSWEYPDNWDRTKVPYYPIETSNNKELYKKYKAFADQTPNVVFRGRLGEYKYQDMHQVIGSVLHDVKVEFANSAVKM